MAYAAFVPARSGSKRVPGKNIKLLGDKPLVIWTLEAFVQCEKIDTVIFSTDSMEYWEIATQHLHSSKLKLDFRTPDDAGDKIKIFDYLKANHAKIFQGPETHFALGLPTVPFRNSHHIAEAANLYETTGKAVFSATEYGFPISFAFYQDEVQGWKPTFPHSPMVTGNTRSQDQIQAFHPNGALYIRSISDLALPEINTLYYDAVPYYMDRNHSIDIDNETDFIVASAIAASGLIQSGS